MQSVKLKSCLAKWTIFLGVGASSVSSMSLVLGSDQPARLPEPQGIPVVRTRAGQYGPRPFSAEYYTAWQAYQARQQMIAQMRQRSEPPNTRLARQKALDAREQHVQQAEQMRGEARPHFVIHHRRSEGEVASGLLGAAAPATWSVSADALAEKKPSLLQRVWGSESQLPTTHHVVLAEEVSSEPAVAGCAAKPSARGLFAKLLNRSSTSAPCATSVSEPAMDEIHAVASLPAGKPWEESTDVTRHLVLKPWSNDVKEANDPESMAWESADESSESGASMVPSDPLPALNNHDLVGTSLPELPEATAFHAMEVVPWHADLKANSKEPSLPSQGASANPDVFAEEKVTPAGAPNLQPAASAARTSPPKKLYDLPTIPDDVMRKYKAR